MRGRRALQLLTAAAMAAGITVGSGGVATADDATDATTAAAVYSLDVANASVSNALINAAHAADITCGTPTAVGSGVTPAVSVYPVADVYGNDIGEAADECLSLQRSFYTYTIVANIQAFNAATGKYATIAGCTSSANGTAIAGQAVAFTNPVPCTYPASSKVAGVLHRVEGLLYTSLTGPTPYRGYSPLYPGGVPKVAL